MCRRSASRFTSLLGVTVFYDNPAGRLHRVLKGLKDVNPGTVSVQDAWARVLHAGQKPDMAVLSRRMVQAFQLPAMVMSEFGQIDDQDLDRDLALRWHDPVLVTFANTLFSNAQIASTLKYDEVSLASLEHCSYLLHRSRREALPAGETLHAIREHVSKIQSLTAHDEEIDPDLREFLLEHAAALAEALEEFFLTGALGIQRVIDEAVGSAVRNGYVPDEVSGEVADDETGSKAAIKRFWGVMGRAALVISMSGNLLAIGQSAYRGLESHPSAKPSIQNTIEVNEMPGSGITIVSPGSGIPEISLPDTAGNHHAS
jgi:hypothetical protein